MTWTLSEQVRIRAEVQIVDSSYSVSILQVHMYFFREILNACFYGISAHLSVLSVAECSFAKARIWLLISETSLCSPSVVFKLLELESTHIGLFYMLYI